MPNEIIKPAALRRHIPEGVETCTSEETGVKGQPARRGAHDDGSDSDNAPTLNPEPQADVAH